jgi:hypothetical protein
MKNATYVDQSDTIRTLTEEEMAVVAGGLSPEQQYDLSHGTGYKSKWYNSFAQSHTYTPSNHYYTPATSLNFLQTLYSNSSYWANFGCIWGAIMN